MQLVHSQKLEINMLQEVCISSGIFAIHMLGLFMASITPNSKFPLNLVISSMPHDQATFNLAIVVIFVVFSLGIALGYGISHFNNRKERTAMKEEIEYLKSKTENIEKDVKLYIQAYKDGQQSMKGAS